MVAADKLVFEDVELDRASRRVLRAGRPVPLQPKVYELLCALVDRRDRVVTKDELLDLLWPNEQVVPDVLTTAIRSLRVALNDTPQRSRFIRTVRSAGYQFVAPIRVRSPGLLPSSVDLARHESFVGRGKELALFERMISDESPRPRVLFVHGPGGIGKTSVLHEVAYRCARRGLAPVHLNGEQLPARRNPFEIAFARAFGAEPPPQLFHALAEGPKRVLLIDNFDLLGDLGSWFIEALFPRLPEQLSIVLASRTAPRARWIADPAWHALVAEVRLLPFDERESREFLATRGVATAHVEAILRFSNGLPLALALAAAAVERGARPEELPRNRDIIDALVEIFTERAPSTRHRHALEVASLLSSFDEALLASMLESDDVLDLYTWLAGQAFVRQAATGLQVHALVRDAVLAHLRWRNPHRLGALAARCYTLHFKLLEEAPDASARIIVTNRIMSLGRHHPTLRPFYTYDDRPDLTVELSDAKPCSDLAQLVARHEGEPSAVVFRRWIDTAVGDLWIARDDREEPAGFALVLVLPVGRLDELAWDPAIVAIRAFLASRGQVAPSARIVVNRYLVGRDSYQAVSPVMQRLHEILNYDLHMLAPEVHSSFNVYGEPEIWAPANLFAQCERLDGFDFELGTRRFGIFGHCWQDIPLRAWANGIISKLVVGATP